VIGFKVKRGVKGLKIFILAIVFIVIAVALGEWIQKKGQNLSKSFIGEIIALILFLEWFCFLLGTWLKWN
jgi:uncharacterized membrane protein YoaK (UPF0700 family)